MKLYMVPLAPNPTKVLLYIAEREQLGTDMGIEQITINPIKGEQNQPEHLARNPLGTLPVLELEDGTYLTESLSIIEYLEDKFSTDSILGSNPEAKAKAKNIERTIELRLAYPAGHYVHVKNSPIGYPPNPEKAAELESVMEVGLKFAENLLSDGRDYLTGDKVSLADFTLQSAFQFLRYADAEIIGDRHHLRAWDNRYRERPAAKAVLGW